MAKRFVNIDRESPLLLPPDLRDWVSWDDPARLIVELVESCDMSAAAVNARGSGSEQYPPAMMLSLLLHSYVHGVFSSREIERLSYVHIGVRYITGDTHPDHDTICKFRRENRDLIKSVFVQSLDLAREAGILELGNVGMDGSKFAGHVSSAGKLSAKAIGRQLRGLEEEKQKLEAEIEALLEEAEAHDRREAQGTQSALDPEIGGSQQFKKKLAQARQELRKKETRRARLEAARDQFAALKNERATQREEIQQAGMGRVPEARSAEVAPEDKINPNDPEAGTMKGHHGWVEGYNAQAMVDCEGSGLLLAARVSQESADSHQLEPNVRELESNVGHGQVQSVVADRGYDNTYQIATIEARGGPEMLCQQQRARKGKTPRQTRRGESQRRRRTRQIREAHRRRLEHPENKARLKRRRETIEPSFGIIRAQMGFQRFRLIGREKVDTEWKLIALAFNLRKLHRNQSWKEALGLN